MRRLAIIPNDPIDLYLSSGYGAGWLKAYFNPARFFDEVYSLAPYEKVEQADIGVIARPTAPRHLQHAIRKLGVDVVRAYGGSHPCEIACRNKVAGVPVIVSVHDTSPDLLHPSVSDADVVLCVSEAVKRLVATRFDRDDRLWILPNRVDFTIMRPRSDEETAPLAAKYPYQYPILHVGRRSEQKNLANLIRAVSILGPSYCLVASGKGPLDAYARVASEHGVLDRCFFLEAIPSEELSLYFSWARCMCNPSRWEGMSIVLIEALAAGAILVTSDIPEIRESVHDGENGLLIEDYESPAAIADAIKTACTNDGLRQRLKANARRSVEQFERSRIDALEAGYYQRVLDLGSAGAFHVSRRTRIARSITGRARRILPGLLKETLLPPSRR